MKCTGLMSLLLITFLGYAETQKKFLVFGGKTGYIGKKIVSIIQKQGHIAIPTQIRLENRADIINEIKKTEPDFIINAAGVTGRPNVDWCENHQQETVRANVLGALNLADIAFIQNIHVAHLGTGCIYNYDNKHPMASSTGFTEEDTPNFFGSFYSRTKILSEKLLNLYPNVLNLRIRMPISSDLNPRGFIGKIRGYKKLINVPNSMSILDDLLPLIPEMCMRRLAGNYNFVNPGAISHNQIMDLYKQYIDPNHTYENFSIEDQDKVLKAKRSNCELSVQKLLKEFPHIPHVQDSIHKIFVKLAKDKDIVHE